MAIVVIVLLMAIYFVTAGLMVKTFRYKGFGPIPRIVGGVLYVSVGLVMAWFALMVALRN